ncbi:sensor histidine kinase [Kiloniella sp.]|uniref:sensor histidine kinase n=1 Tax=Kiloniella sp. TaxID=1938587 RepID=UPI003B02B309
MFLSFTEQRERFHEQARFVNQTVLSNIQVVNTGISSMESLFEASDFVNPAEFALVANRALKNNPLVAAIIYAPAVYEAEYIELARYLKTQAGYSKFNISHSQQGNINTPSFPVLYANPESNRQAFGGQEVSQYQEFSTALGIAIDSQEETYARGPTHVTALKGHWFLLGVVSRRLIPEQEDRGEVGQGLVGLRLNPEHFLSQNALPINIRMKVEASNIVGSEKGVIFDNTGNNTGAYKTGDYEFRVIHHIPIGNSNLRLQFSRPVPILSLLSNLFTIAFLLGLTVTSLLLYAFSLVTSRNKEIEMQVTERTHELDDKNKTLNETLLSLRESVISLKKAEKERESALEEAQRANQIKSEFLASMSHELRTPLNAILGFSDILSEQYFGPPGAGKYREYAKDIHHSGEHLLELVNDLLDISTIDTGKKSLHKEWLSIKGIIDDCERIIHEKVQSKSLSLKIEIPDNLTSIYADKRSIKQILLNLLSNSAKFTPDGGKITLRASTSEKNTKIVVMDNGVGIPPEKLTNITKPFFREQQDAYVSEPGWGLGLAISQSLVELHSGLMIVESDTGKGTTVINELPAPDSH